MCKGVDFSKTSLNTCGDDGVVLVEARLDQEAERVVVVHQQDLRPRLLHSERYL